MQSHSFFASKKSGNYKINRSKAPFFHASASILLGAVFLSDGNVCKVNLQPKHTENTWQHLRSFQGLILTFCISEMRSRTFINHQNSPVSTETKNPRPFNPSSFFRQKGESGIHRSRWACDAAVLGGLLRWWTPCLEAGSKNHCCDAGASSVAVPWLKVALGNLGHQNRERYQN